MTVLRDAPRLSLESLLRVLAYAYRSVAELEATPKGRVYEPQATFLDVREPLYIDPAHFASQRAYQLLLSRLESQVFLDQIAFNYRHWDTRRHRDGHAAIQ